MKAPEEGSSRVVITDKVIAEYGHQLILRPRTYTDGHWLSSRYAEGIDS